MTKTIATLKILWAALILEVCALFTVSFLILKGIIPYQSFMHDQTAYILSYVLMGFSVLLLIAQQVFLRKRPLLNNALPEHIESLRNKFFIFHLIAIALADSVVIYGFMIFLITGFLTFSFSTMGIGTLALVLSYPSEDINS